MAGLSAPVKHLSNDLVELAKKASTATISHELEKLGFKYVYMAGILPIQPGAVLSGRAYTLRYLPPPRGPSRLPHAPGALPQLRRTRRHRGRRPPELSAN